MSLSLALIIAAATFADLDGIDRQVAAFTAAEGGAAVPLDRRLRLKPCTAPLALAWRAERRDTVIVQCPDRGGWRLFVPVSGGQLAPSGPPAISRGDPVTIAVSGGGFSVSQPGEALEAGATGAWIRVRPIVGATKPGGQVMRAQVIRPGLVGVPLQ